jgi:hypothetical protein
MTGETPFPVSSKVTIPALVVGRLWRSPIGVSTLEKSLFSRLRNGTKHLSAFS